MIIYKVLGYSFAFLFLISLSVEGRGFSEAELQGMDIYQLEVLKSKSLSKENKKIVRALLKNKDKIYNSCLIARDKFYSMPLNEFRDEGKRINSKSLRALYKKISKTKERYEELREQYKVKFSVEFDEYSKNTNFRTNMVSRVILEKGVCPSLRGRSAKAIAETTNIFLRGFVIGGKSTVMQVYITTENFSDDGVKHYFGITSAASKSLGRLKTTLIDIDYDISEYFDSYTYQYAVTLDFDKLKTLYENNVDEVLKIYSSSGPDVLVTIPFNQIKIFYEGIKSDTNIYSALNPIS
mgnify:CR=1 FL=1